MPTPVAAGVVITIVNKGSQTLSVYPHVGGYIDAGAQNAATTVLSGNQLIVASSSTSQWNTVINSGLYSAPTQLQTTNLFTSTSQYIVGVATAGTGAQVNTTGTIYFTPSTGIVNASDFNVTSDARLKTVVGKLENALNSVKSLNGVKYHWNEQARQKGISNDRLQVGLLAQEVNLVLPEAVGGTADQLGVMYDKLIPLIIEAIKELSARVDRLEK